MKERCCRLIACCWLLLPGMGTAGEAVPQEATVPGSLMGTWDVEHVAVDTADQMHWKFHPDDPSVVGRQVTIDEGQIRSDLGKELNCKPSVWKRRSATWKFLVASGLLRSPTAGGYVPPTPRDYGLKVAPKTLVTVFSLCGTPSMAPDRPDADAWVAGDIWAVQEGANRLLVHLDNQTMLVLARRASSAKPAASFPCAKATTATEKAICGSFTLAGWDRSVALAWRRLVENGRVAAEVFEEQKAWLRERDTCRSDAACLEDKMSQRVNDLGMK